MTIEITIKNVDDEAYMDIDYFIKKHLLKIEGIEDTGIGSGGTGENSVHRSNFIIKRK